MTSELQAALSTMRVHRAAVVENNLAMLVLIREAVNMEKALQFYANPTHYLDGVLMRCDEQGLMTIPDEGMVAKWALHQMDASGAALIVVEEELAKVGEAPQ